MAFFIVGLSGLAVAPLLKSTVREPIRGGLDPSAADRRLERLLLEVASALAGKPSFWGLALGAAASSMMGYGLLFWMPSFLVRSFSLSLRAGIDVLRRTGARRRSCRNLARGMARR